jgi:hypothetical protein
MNPQIEENQFVSIKIAELEIISQHSVPYQFKIIE